MRTSRPVPAVAVLAAALHTSACGGASPRPTASAAPSPTASAAPSPTASATPAPARVAMPPAATATKVRELGGITEYHLSNGLTLLLFPDPSASRLTVNITYGVGSRVEGYGETGMAHLLEHMAFKGTPRHRNILKLVDARGGVANGSTGTDRTNYWETLPGTADNLDWALDLEADRMINCTISADDLATEFSVVRNELEMGENDPVGVLEARMMATAYLWHNYGKDTIGSRSDVERVPVDNLRAFYQRYYQPDDATLVVAGKFDPQAALAAVVTKLGAIPRPTRALPATYTLEPPQDGERTVVVRRNGKVPIVGALYHATAGSSPDWTAMNAALDLLTREPSGLLYQKLVKTHLASRVWSDAYMFREPSAVMLMAEVVDPRRTDEVARVLTETVEGLGAAKLDAAALERWRSAATSDFDHTFASSEGSAKLLTEYIALGDWRTLFAAKAATAAVTAADVTRVARAYLQASNRTLGEFLPTPDAPRAPLTTTPDVAAIAAAAPAPAPIAGEAFEPTIDNLEARTVRKTLAGGLRAALLAKKTRAGTVVATLRLRFGDARSLAGKAVVGQLVGELLTRGTTTHDLQALRDLADKLEAQIWISRTDFGLVVHVATFREHLADTLALVAEQLRTPSFPAAELEIVRAARLTDLAAERDDPSRRAWRELRRRLEPWPAGDPRATMTVDEEIAAVKKVTRADVVAFWKDLVGADHGEVAIVGDFDPDATTAQLDHLLGDWRSRAAYARLDDKRFDAAAADVVLDTPDKENAQLELAEQVAMKDDDADYAAWLVLGQILGGDAASRVWMRLREHEGLSYGAWLGTFASAEDPVGGVWGSAIVAPQNLAKAKASFLDEIRRIATGPVTAEELTRVKDAWTERLTRRLGGDDEVAAMLADGLYLGRTLEWQRQLDAKVRAVTAADVARVATARLAPDRLIVVEARDGAKAAAGAAAPAPAPSSTQAP